MLIVMVSVLHTKGVHWTFRAFYFIIMYLVYICRLWDVRVISIESASLYESDKRKFNNPVLWWTLSLFMLVNDCSDKHVTSKTKGLLKTNGSYIITLIDSELFSTLLCWFLPVGIYFVFACGDFKEFTWNLWFYFRSLGMCKGLQNSDNISIRVITTFTELEKNNLHISLN